MSGNPLEGITSIFESKDAGLDQVKESTQAKLSALQEKVEGETANSTIAELKQKALEGLKVDLEELGVTDNKLIAQYQAEFESAWSKKQTEILKDNILESVEAKALVDFVTDPNNLGKLGERINEFSHAPIKMKLIQLANSMGMGWLVGFVESFLKGFSFKGKKKEGEKPKEEAPKAAEVDPRIFEEKDALTLTNWPEGPEREAAFHYLNQKIGGGLTQMIAGESGITGEKPARISIEGKVYELRHNTDPEKEGTYELRDLEIDKRAYFDGRIEGPDDGNPPSLKFLVNYHKQRENNN